MCKSTLCRCLCVVTLTLVSCAPLNPHNTPMEDVGEVTLRVIGFPLSLGISESIIAAERRMQAKDEARQAERAYWLSTLTPQQRLYVNRQETLAARATRLGIAPIFHPYTPPTYPQPVRRSPDVRADSEKITSRRIVSSALEEPFGTLRQTSSE
jgi:hypothetical protein